MSASKSFFQLQTVAAALARLFEKIAPLDKAETIPTETALGRVLAENLFSPMDLPNFTRSTMDGYAVRAVDTFGASDSLPAYLKVVGQISMGLVPDFALKPTEAAEIHTGAMLPAGADAVVMIERTQRISADEIEVLSPVAVGENLVQIGEDVREGSAILYIGHRLRPQDIGALLAVGITQVNVAQKPTVAILSSGNELVNPEDEIQLGQVRDINAAILAALITELGAKTLRLGIARDSFESLYPLAKSGLEQADMLILSAGSSVSARDLSAEVISQLGQAEILQHGLAVKPGKPTIIAVCDGKAVIGLPGNPVSALLVARQIVLPALRYLVRERDVPTAYVNATLQQNIASTTGREDTIPVRLIQENGTYTAIPILGKSNLIYTLLRADGLIHIPLDISGYKAGTELKVLLF